MCHRSPVLLLILGLAVQILATIDRAGDDQRVLHVTEPVSRETADAVTFSGRIDAVASVDVRPHVSGTLAKILFRDGSEVKQGDVLFEIDPAPYRAAVNKAEADAALAEARRKRSEADFQRALQLLTRRAISREDHDKAASDRAESEAALRLAQAYVEQAKSLLRLTKVVAPISGKTGRSLIDVGNLIRGGENGPVLVTLVSIDPVYVYFDIDERNALRLQKKLQQEKAKDVRLPIAVGLAGEEGFPRAAVVNFIDNRVNPDTSSVRVRGTLPNLDHALMPGLSVRVRMQFWKKGTGR